jgi:hypothetical protein
MEAIISSYQKLEIAFTKPFLDGEEITIHGMENDDARIYSFTRIYGEMITADKFISHIQNCLQLIDTAIEVKVEKTKGKAISAPDINLPLSLMILNF